MTYSACFALFPGQGRKRWRLLVVSSVLLGILAFLPELHAQLTTTGLRHNFDANGDQTLADGWESFVNPGQRPWNFTGNTRVGTGNETAVQTNTAIQANLGGVAEIYGISGRLNFPRTNNDINSNRDRGTSNSYVSAGNGQDATWEFWFKPENVTDNQILWEGGGSGTGSSFTIRDNGDLQWVIKNGGATDSIVQSISALNDGEYHHFVGVYNRDDPGSGTGEDTMTLFIDGVQVATTLGSAPTNMNGWDGGDPASLGGRGSTVGGSGGDLGTGINGYRNLDGKVAAFRFYNSALDGAAVVNNIDAVRVENVYFDGGGATGTLGDQLNFDTNLVSSFNQNTHINGGQSATLEAGNELRTRTLFIGNDGTSELPGYTPGAGEVAPADGDGTLTMNGGSITTNQVVLGFGGNVGEFNFVDGTISVNRNRTGGYTGGDPQAFHIGLSQSDGDPATDRSVFTMGTAGGGTNPVLDVRSGRFEIGDNGTTGGNPRVNATFNMEGGTFTSNQNLIIGQGGIANNSSVIFNMNGGSVNTSADLNINDGTAELNVSGGTLSVRSLQTQNGSTNTDVINLSGGVLRVRDALRDRNGTTTMNINGGTLDLDKPFDSSQNDREVENLNFSSGTIEFSISDPVVGTTALRVGSQEDPNGTGNFAGTGQIDVELDNRNAAATTTTWTGASGEWTPSNNVEWDNDNPIQYITNGTAYSVIIPNSAGTTISGLGDLTSANSDFDLSVTTTFNPNDTLQIVANTNVGTSPLKAIINSPGSTITRNSDLLIDPSVGADAAALDIIDGTLDLASSGSDLQIGRTANVDVVQTGGAVKVRNLTFGEGAGTFGGELFLNGGSFEATGSVTRTDLSVPQARIFVSDGSLTVGGDVALERFRLGETAGTSGSFAVSPGRKVTTSSHFYVGHFGNGSLTLTDGMIDANGGFHLAVQGGSTGSFEMGTMDGSTAPTMEVSGGNFETANNGTGTFKLYSGTVTQVTNNWITGQSATSVANAQIGGGSALATYETTVNSDWNTNSGNGKVDVLQNGLVSVGRSLNLGSGANPESGLELKINGGEVRVGALNGGGDLNYRGNGPKDFITITDGKLTIADDFFFNDGVGKFQINGSGNEISVGDVFSQAAGNTLIVAPDPLGLSAINVGASSTPPTIAIGGTIEVDESLIGTVAPNSASTFTTPGAWDATDTNWDKGNPALAQISANDRITVIDSPNAIIDSTGLTISGAAGWTLDLSDPNRVQIVAPSTYGGAPAHAILCASGVATRATDLLIDASGAPADASGLTIEGGDTLQMALNTSITVQNGARLAGEGIVQTSGTGSTIIGNGGILDPGNTATGLPGGASLAGRIEFEGDLTSQAGSTWNIDLVDPTQAVGSGLGSDFVFVRDTLTLDPGVTLNFAGFRPEIGSVYTIAEYGLLIGSGFDGLSQGKVLNGYQIDYGAGFGGTGPGFISLTAVVPEPSTALALFGMILSTFFRRRRRLLVVADGQ